MKFTLMDGMAAGQMLDREYYMSNWDVASVHDGFMHWLVVCHIFVYRNDLTKNGSRRMLPLEQQSAALMRGLCADGF